MEFQSSIWQDDQGTNNHGGPTPARLVKELRVTIQNPVCLQNGQHQLVKSVSDILPPLSSALNILSKARHSAG